MGITPLDIQNKEFERSFRGYDIEDVDEFLDRIAKDLEQLMRENQDLKDQLAQLTEKNKNYQKMESTMHTAIVVAQETAEEVKQNAKREAELIKREAEREAKNLVEEARSRSSRILDEQEELFRKAQVFKLKFRSFIEAQLAALEGEEWLEEPQKEEKVEEKATEFISNYKPDVVAEEVVKDDFKLEEDEEPVLDFEADYEIKPVDDFEKDN
ncbi:MAG: DivIVA domain-containing protein [Bacillota bacterium]|nr:DivIVA domain-containing protein [Bacillota bacterium]